MTTIWRCMARPIMRTCSTAIGKRAIPVCRSMRRSVAGQDGNYYDYTNNTIHLQNHDKYGYRDYVLLEELIHAYQYQYYGEESNMQRTLNNEIEAKVGWLAYRERMQNPLTSTQNRRAFNEIETQQAFYNLTHFCMQRLSGADIRLQEQYVIAVRGLQTSPNYANIPYLSDVFDFNALYKLMKDC